MIIIANDQPFTSTLPEQHIPSIIRFIMQSLFLVILFSLQLWATQSFAQTVDPYAAKVPPIPVRVYNAIPAIPDSRIELLEEKIFERTNELRTSQGVAPLKSNLLLQAIARSHSQDMAIHHYFDHVGPLQDQPMDRAHMSGICGLAKDCAMIAENVNMTSLQGVSGALQLFNSDDQVPGLVSLIVDNPQYGFMADAGHRGNLLDNRTQEMSVGISLSDDGTLYVTQDFIRVDPLPAGQ